MAILWGQKRTDKEHIARVAQHPVTFHNLLFDVVSFQESAIKSLRRNGPDSAQDAMQVSKEEV